MTDEDLARLRAHDSNISAIGGCLKPISQTLSANFWNGALGRKGRLSRAWLILLPPHGLAQPASLTQVCFDLLVTRAQKITLGQMRESGASRIIVHCGDHECGHSITMDPDLWPDNLRLSDLEERFVCTICGHRGADVRPLFEPASMGTDA